MALWTRTEGPKIFICVDPGTVTIVPLKFYRIIPYRPNVNQLRIGNRDKLPAGAVPLAKSAGAIPTQVCLWIDSHMAIVPKDSNNALCFDVIDLGWKSANHASLLALQNHSSTKPSPTAVMHPIFVRFTKYVRDAISGLPMKVVSVIGKKRVLPKRSSCSGAPGMT